MLLVASLWVCAVPHLQAIHNNYKPSTSHREQFHHRAFPVEAKSIFRYDVNQQQKQRYCSRIKMKALSPVSLKESY